MLAKEPVGRGAQNDGPGEEAYSLGVAPGSVEQVIELGGPRGAGWGGGVRVSGLCRKRPELPFSSWFVPSCASGLSSFTGEGRMEMMGTGQGRGSFTRRALFLLQAGSLGQALPQRSSGRNQSCPAAFSNWREAPGRNALR